MRNSKKQDELLAVERLKASERLASEIAHELNTPLGGILMYSHLLLDDMDKRDPLQENVLKINKLAHRCKIILQGLIDFANNEKLEMSPVDVNRTLRDVVGFIEDHVLFKGISIESHLDPGLPNIKGDESKLGQLFMNLVINAGESMEGQGKLTLSTDLAPETNDVRIACSDTGGGIADEHKGRIFEPFFTTKKRLKGTGLGLSISHGIVELHRGTITVQSDREHGSTFTVFLPTTENVEPCSLSLWTVI
ncbi:MAG: PAS domain-containing sensor histidine kinase, partial [Deltaproteobacteria bacterium]|nr:PAS domain-containing sensor histidine kinase [Deltaproteobacteria bacterium]